MYHRLGLGEVLLKASFRSSRSTCSAFAVDVCPTPTKCRLSLSKVKLSGAHLGPRLGQVAPTWSMLGTSWAQVEPMLGLGRPMLGLCWPRLGLCSAYVGVCWPHVGLCWPLLSHLGGYVGHMLGICWLSWAYVGDMLGNLCAQHQRNVD